MEINNKELKQILKEQSDDFKRYVDTLAEDFHSQVKLIGEQYGSIKETLDTHTKILDSHTKTLEFHIDAITSIKDTLDYHTEMLGSMKEDMEIVKTDMGFVRNFLKRKIDIDEFSVLERRVTVLESKVRAR